MNSDGFAARTYYRRASDVGPFHPMSANLCFDGVCECSCNKAFPDFDRIIREETKFDITLDWLCRSNIGWFGDKSHADHLIGEWDIEKTDGVYLLWHKNGYCADHQIYHMRCLYVGKGIIPLRLFDHWNKKDFSEEMLVYWTYLEMPNRHAKYVEQLLLDLFAIPFNKSESRGRQTLCAYLTQYEVD